MSSKREQLAQWTQIVADSGDLSAIEATRPTDATTNPSLLLAAAKAEGGHKRIAEARHFAEQLGQANNFATLCDAFATLTGKHILTHIPGLISTEVDARLSFDTRATLERARRIINLYREIGVSKERVLIKIAATWEGIRAVEVLEEEGIACNLTLLFSYEQAIAAAEASATLISPFVGRIYDWYKKNGTDISNAEQDPGVQSVRRIYNSYRARGFSTVVMGASFRYPEQIEALAGCDKLTISPALLEQLGGDNGALQRILDPSTIDVEESNTAAMSEASFRWAMNENAMATELLADGIRRFAKDQEALEALLLA
jgi:transaldolase